MATRACATALALPRSLGLGPQGFQPTPHHANVTAIVIPVLRILTLFVFVLLASPASALARFQASPATAGILASPVHKYLYAHADPVNGVDPSGHEFSISGVFYSISARVYLAAQTYQGVIAAGRGIASGLFLAGVTFNERFRNEAAAFGPGVFTGAAQEFGSAVYEIRGMYLAQRVIQTAVNVGAEATRVGETALKGVADDMLVHFAPAKDLKTILQRGLCSAEGGAGVHFFKVGEVKSLTPKQIKAAIGDLAGSSSDVSVAVVVNPQKLKDLQEFQKAFWKEYVTRQQGVAAEFIRSVPGGGAP